MANKKPGTRGVTRRGFLKGAGVSAAGTMLIEADLFGAEQATGAVVGPGRTAVILRVNGKDRKLMIEPRTTLADVLRLDLDLTGTKIGCDRGACSACTVTVDGVPVNSCLTLAIDATGREIRTIEGLAQGEQLHAVQEAFIEYDALQCGFCTPGMVMSCAALLARNSSPTLDDVKSATSGNICRCGTYPKVFEATLAAARKEQGR